MNERTLVTKIKKYLSEIGAFAFKINDNFTSGIPDLCCCYKGRVIFLEVKTPIGKVANIQEYFINQIKKHGCEAHIVRSLDEVKKLLDK